MRTALLTRDVFVHLHKRKTSLLTAVLSRISQRICHSHKCGPGPHARTGSLDGTPSLCLKPSVRRRTWPRWSRREYGLGRVYHLTLANKTLKAPKHDTLSMTLWGRLCNWFKSLQLTKLRLTEKFSNKHLKLKLHCWQQNYNLQFQDAFNSSYPKTKKTRKIK